MDAPTTRPPLLAGPYLPPPVRKGERVTCLYRDVECVVTSWTDAPIPWPRGRNPEHPRGGWGLLVTAELGRAVRTESAMAVAHWFGVSGHTAWRWRVWAGVDGRTDTTPGTRNELTRAALLGVEALQEREMSDAECDAEYAARSVTSKRLDLGRHLLGKRWAGTGWTPEMVAVLGTAPDGEPAAAWGKSAEAVRRRGVCSASPRSATAAAAERAIRLPAPAFGG